MIVPDPPKEIKDAQRARDKDRLEDSKVKVASTKGSIFKIPVTGENVPDLDPLKQTAPTPVPEDKPKPTPPPVIATPPPTPRPEAPRPRIANPAEVKPPADADGGGKKGKKGKGDSGN
jgi:hypothetical protein